MSYINVGTTVLVDGEQKGEVRGIQALEPPVSYLVLFPNGSHEWLKGDRVSIPAAKKTANPTSKKK